MPWYIYPLYRYIYLLETLSRPLFYPHRHHVAPTLFARCLCFLLPTESINKLAKRHNIFRKGKKKKNAPLPSHRRVEPTHRQSRKETRALPKKQPRAPSLLPMPHPLRDPHPLLAPLLLPLTPAIVRRGEAPLQRQALLARDAPCSYTPLESERVTVSSGY